MITRVATVPQTGRCLVIPAADSGIKPRRTAVLDSLTEVTPRVKRPQVGQEKASKQADRQTGREAGKQTERLKWEDSEGERSSAS